MSPAQVIAGSAPCHFDPTRTSGEVIEAGLWELADLLRRDPAAAMLLATVLGGMAADGSLPDQMEVFLSLAGQESAMRRAAVQLWAARLVLKMEGRA